MPRLPTVAVRPIAGGGGHAGQEAERFGGPQVLTARQVPDPVAGPGQVVVRTSAADVLFVPDRSRAPAPARRHPDLTAVSGALGAVAYLGFSVFGCYCWQNWFMAHQFRPVDRDAEMLLPHNMLDWVPDGHAVRVVIDAVERLMTRDLTARLVPPSRKGSAAGPARYDPVMLLTVWLYAYLRGVLSTRAVEDRCRYDATFRVACGRLVPDHTTFSRFRRHLFAQAGLAEDLFCRVLRVCALAGLGRLTVVAGDGVKIAANASKEASRTEAG